MKLRDKTRIETFYFVIHLGFCRTVLPDSELETTYAQACICARANQRNWEGTRQVVELTSCLNNRPDYWGYL